jgi:hypothetical protein
MMLTAFIREESGKKSQFSPGIIRFKIKNLEIGKEKSLEIKKQKRNKENENK